MLEPGFEREDVVQFLLGTLVHAFVVIRDVCVFCSCLMIWMNGWEKVSYWS